MCELKIDGTVDLKEAINNIISQMFSDKEYTFEAYMLTKDQRKLKRFILYEGRPNAGNDNNNNKRCLDYSISKCILNTFTSDEAEYDIAANISDNQKKFYIIPQSNEYRPFVQLGLEIDDSDSYKDKDVENIEGVFFRFERGDSTIWAFQYFWPSSIPNKHSNSFQFISRDSEESYEFLNKKLLIIGKKIDLLVINDKIITKNIGLLETHYDFQLFIRTEANKIIKKIKDICFVDDVQKIEAYVNRPKLRYSKKILKIEQFNVINLSKEKLYEKITTLSRWKNVFNVNEDTKTISLKTFWEVERFIDLLNERYTRSDVTGEEYDTTAKTRIVNE